VRSLGVLAGAAVAAVGLALAAPCQASPEDIFGYGPRGAAMGATGAASAEGFEAAYSNPALLSSVRRNKLTLGYLGATFGLDAEVAGERRRIGQDPARGTYIGAEVPVPLGGRLRDRIGLGLAFYTPTDIIVRGRILYPEVPQFPLLPDRAQCLTVRGGLGGEVGWGIRVGIGFAALAEITGDVTVATDASGKVGTRVEDQLVATYAPVLGVTYDLPIEEKIRLGLVYKGEMTARFAVAIDGTKLSTLQIPVFNIAGIAQYDPAQATLEAAWTRGRRVVAAGATFKRWSKYPGPLESTLPCPADEPDCSTLTPPKIDYRDTLALHAGVDQGFALAPELALHLRAGAMFEPTPMPSSLPPSDAFDLATRKTTSLPTRFYDASRVGLTAGVGIALAARVPLTIDTFAQYHALLPREMRSEGDTTSEVTVSGRVLAGGMLVGVAF
jgi:long-chain fatty acid transport protein